jgi:hypothetical protein
MKLLPKKTTEELEYNTTPLMNVVNSYIFQKKLRLKETVLHRAVWSFYDVEKVNSAPFKVGVEFFSDKFGKPYFRNYSHRTAVWGLEIKSTKFVFYWSLRGLVIQVPYDIKKAQVELVLNTLHKQCFGKVIRDWRDL